MNKITIKLKGFTAQELSDAVSNINLGGDYKIEIEKKDKDDRNIVGETIQFFTQNKETIYTLLGAAYIVWNEIQKIRKSKLEKQKLEFSKQKFEFEKQKFKDKVKKPEISVIQQHIGNEIVLPFEFKSVEDFKNYLNKNSIDLNAKNIKSIYFK